MYKHVAKQRKLTTQNKEARLSDEELSDESDEEHSDSDSNSGSDDDSEDGEGEEDDGLGLGLAPSESGSESEEEEEATAPPAGFPSALEAVENPIALPAAGGEGEMGEDGELHPVCVVCPSKALKAGKMLEVHLGSKDHKRRLTRFTAHVRAADFPAESLALDARAISAQLDKIVRSRLVEQTLHGGVSIPGPSTSSKPSAPKKEAVVAKPKTPEDLAKLAGAIERQSRRAELREAKKQLHVVRRANKKDKVMRLKRRNAREAGEGKEGGEGKPSGERKKGGDGKKSGEVKKATGKKEKKAVEGSDAKAAKPSPSKAPATPKSSEKKKAPKPKGDAPPPALVRSDAPTPESKKRKAPKEGKREKKSVGAVVA